VALVNKARQVSRIRDLTGCGPEPACFIVSAVASTQRNPKKRNQGTRIGYGSVATEACRARATIG